MCKVHLRGTPNKTEGVEQMGWIIGGVGVGVIVVHFKFFGVEEPRKPHDPFDPRNPPDGAASGEYE